MQRVIFMHVQRSWILWTKRVIQSLQNFRSWKVDVCFFSDATLCVNKELIITRNLSRIARRGDRRGQPIRSATRSELESWYSNSICSGGLQIMTESLVEVSWIFLLKECGTRDKKQTTHKRKWKQEINAKIRFIHINKASSKNYTFNRHLANSCDVMHPQVCPS